MIQSKVKAEKRFFLPIEKITFLLAYKLKDPKEKPLYFEEGENERGRIGVRATRFIFGLSDFNPGSDPGLHFSYLQAGTNYNCTTIIIIIYTILNDNICDIIHL